MSRDLKEKDIKNILYGATFLGSGGGGALKDGLKMLDEIVEEDKDFSLKMVNPSKMDDNDYAVTVAGIGAPRAMEEHGFGPEALYVYEGMENVVFMSGKKLRYVMAGELGGFNTMVPMYVAVKKGIPFVDGDGNGRAVPELNTGLFPIYNIPANPVVLAGRNGDVVVTYLGDPEDTKAAENIARHFSMAYGMSAAFSTWLVNGKDIIEKLVPKSISNCERIGETILRVKDEELDFLEEINKVMGCKELCKGEISEIVLKTEGGFDFGTTIIKGKGQYQGKTFYIDYKNENLLVKDEAGKVLVTVPDLITMLDLDTMEPITNADTKEGMNVGFYGVSAPENWLKDEEGFACWLPILEKVGYKGEAIHV